MSFDWNKLSKIEIPKDLSTENVYYYKIDDNECVIKLGKLKSEPESQASGNYKLEFVEEGAATEFTSITLTLDMKNITNRIKYTPKEKSVVDEGKGQGADGPGQGPEGPEGLNSGEPPEWAAYRDEIVKDLQIKMGDSANNVENVKLLTDLSNAKTEEELKIVITSGITIFQELGVHVDSLVNAIGEHTTAALKSITSLFNLGGGSKRSMMSPFSRQFELPMPCHAKKRRSRSKKSRGGRRKKGKHSRKHHK